MKFSTTLKLANIYYKLLVQGNRKSQFIRKLLSYLNQFKSYFKENAETKKIKNTLLLAKMFKTVLN